MSSSVRFKSVNSCSNEDAIHCAKNLLGNDPTKKWLTAKAGEQRLTCVLEFDQACSISSIEIGNDGCAFIELLVSKTDDWTILLPPTVLMTPAESRSNTNRNQIRIFQSSDFHQTALTQKWERLKIICEQKFNRSKQYGLCYIKLNSSPVDASHSVSPKKSSSIINFDDDEDETGDEQSKIGSFFSRRQTEKCSTKISSMLNQSSSTVADELLRRKSQTPKKTLATTSSEPANDKSSLMKNVHFVLSGFQNPFRSELRSKAIQMGATYHDDWKKNCTHLICAFSNTPKSLQVQQSGKGFIVNSQWILDCFDKNHLFNEQSYELERNSEKNPKKQIQTNIIEQKTIIKRKLDNDEENSKRTKKKQDELPDFFKGIHFYVSYGDFDENTLLDIVRVIFAYDGTLEQQITSDVKYVITKRNWNADFEKISMTNPEINFVSLDWLQDCHDQESFASTQSHLIAP